MVTAWTIGVNSVKAKDRTAAKKRMAGARQRRPGSTGCRMLPADRRSLNRTNGLTVQIRPMLAMTPVVRRGSGGVGSGGVATGRNFGTSDRASSRHLDDGAVDVRRLIGCEPRVRVRDLLGLAEAAHRHLVFHHLDH